jgi:hypothetical protein
MSVASLLSRTASFAPTEEGWVTPLSLYAFVITGIIGGLALDLSHLVAARTQLQAAADIAAHAALYNRDIQNDPLTAKDRAIVLARDSMPSERYGDYLNADDIEFGWFDGDTRTFTPDPNARQAARVRAFRISERTNTVASSLLRLAGITDFDVVASSIFETYRPFCFREGLVGEGWVDLQSNTSYTNGFCVHSNQYVSVNSNNYYEPGTVVSMPDTGDIVLPNSGFDSNEGLYDALHAGRYNIRILNQLDDIVAGMTDSRSEHYRADYVTRPEPVTVNWRTNLGVEDFTPGRVNVITCNGKKVNLAGDVYDSMVIIGYGCDFKINNGGAFSNATLITTHTGVKSIDAPNGLRLGVDDDCADGGEAQFITYGGIGVASGLELYGSQMIAAGPISFQALANGIEGASIISGETIDGTSNSSFGFCGTGMNNNFEAEYFRLRA